MISGKGYSWGRTDITLHNITEIIDAMGEVSASSEVNSTIKGDFQYVTQDNEELLELGWVKVGDAILYCASSYVIEINDEVTVDSVRWKLIRKIEGPTVDGVEVHQGWTATRKNG